MMGDVRLLRATVFAAVVGGFTGLLGAEERLAPGTLTERVACRSDPSQTYTVYLPSSYSTERKWPALLIFDPRGRGTFAAELFRAGAERYGWLLLSSDNTRSDGPFEPNAKAVAAMGPELQRFAVDEKRIYAAGFSGTVSLAWAVARQSAGLAGVIACGAPVTDKVTRDVFTVAQYGAVGDIDFNNSDMRRIDAMLEERGLPHRLEIFEGAHRWLPPELGQEAIEWMELVAMKQARRATDAALVEALFRKDMDRARALEPSPLRARRRYEAIARTFSGLRDVEEARQRADTLRAGAEKEQKDEQRGDEFERRYLENDMTPALASIRSGEQPIPVAQVQQALRLHELQERARGTSHAALAARSLLENVFVMTSFYLFRDLSERKEYARAALALQVAATVKPDEPIVHYNLACMLARTGRRQPAIEALGRAVELGFRDGKRMDEDPDLESLRGRPEYATIRGRLGVGRPER
jgi:dienelactone hydrolase